MFALPQWAVIVTLIANVLASGGLMKVCICILDHATPKTVPGYLAVAYIGLGGIGFLSLISPILGWPVSPIGPLALGLTAYLLTVDRRRGRHESK